MCLNGIEAHHPHVASICVCHEGWVGRHCDRRSMAYTTTALPATAGFPLGWVLAPIFLILAFVAIFLIVCWRRRRSGRFSRLVEVELINL
ncbi:unnamed protein product [Auanema sp. JU1783]|nr:unnamed protein product [Auanema sp. JU1783]